NFYPELSGVADSIVATGRQLAARGHHIRYYVPHYGPQDFSKVGVMYKEPDLGERITVVRFSSLHIPGPSGQSRLAPPPRPRPPSISRFTPDIIHTHLFGGVGLEARFAAKLLNKPFVGTNHTAITEFARYLPIKGDWVVKKNLDYAIWYYDKCDI